MNKPIEKGNLLNGIRKGIAKGWKGWIWLLRILIPVSFATALLVYSGWIYRLDFLLAPVMDWLSLPASAAIVLLIGIFTGIYGTVAALSVMNFSMDHMVLIAVFTLISHNLIQESLVQGKSGINPFFAAMFRLFMAFWVTFICAKISGTSNEANGLAINEIMGSPAASLESMIKTWAAETLRLCVQIICIIVPLMAVLEIATQYRIIDVVNRLTSPVISVMGLSRSTGMLWLTASIFGLAYGSAVIVEETAEKKYKKSELTKLHLSIGVNHAMIEDPALFLPLGLPLFWLWVPRIAAAISTAWLYRVVSLARSCYDKRVVHKKICSH